MKGLKKLFEDYGKLPNSPQKARLSRDIRIIKNKIVRDLDYVGVIYMLQFLNKQAKDRLFIDLLDRSLESSLFILAFADSDMYAYKRAYEVEVRNKGDESGLENDIQVIFDSMICDFLKRHKSNEDLEYVHKLVDGATWLESAKISKN